MHWAYLTVFLRLGGGGFVAQLPARRATPILRQQLKWITRGTVLAITPFTLFYVLPYLFGVMPSPAMKVSVLSLGLLPLTFGYAIFRYRLMDVDLIFKRGMAYTLAAAAIAGGYFAVVAAIAELVHTRVPSSGPLRVGGRRSSLPRCCLIRSANGFRRSWTSSSTARVTTTGAR